MTLSRCRRLAAAFAIVGAAGAVVSSASPASAFGPLNWFTPGYFVHATDAELGDHNWTGFIVDPDFGFESLKLSGEGGRLVDDLDGIRLGAEVGYDVEVNNFVFGVVGDAFYTWLDADSRTRAASFDADMDYMGTLRGRLGYSFGRLMVYGTGGWAFGDLEITNAAGLSDDTSLSGWAAGGGLEYMWNRNFSVRLEYIRVDYGDEQFTSLPAGSDRVDVEMDLINFGLITRF